MDGLVNKLMCHWKWAFAFLVIIIVIILVSIFASFLPFEPVEVSQFQMTPTSVCRGEFVEFYITQPPRHQWWYTHGKATGFNYWVADDDPRPFRYAYFEADGSMFDTTDVKQPTRRVAPIAAGTYQGGIDVTVHGYIFGFIPVQQQSKLRSDNWITVEDCDAGESSLREQIP